MTIKLRIFENAKEAGIYAAAITEQIIIQKENPVLGLATGSSPIQYYQALINLHKNGLDLSRIITINLDEYVGLPPTHTQSYHNYMEFYLFSKVNIGNNNHYIPDGLARDLSEECKVYDSILDKFPRDLQILGIGSNGHIGFNEPDQAFQTTTHVVELRNDTVLSNAKYFNDTNEVPKFAITMGIKSIMEAKQIILLAFGENKATIVKKALQTTILTEVPATILQLHENVTFVLDKESAKYL